MGNRNRGEVTFDADGQNWTLRMSINAICDIEERFGKPINQIAESLGGGGAAAASAVHDDGSEKDDQPAKSNVRVSDIRMLFHAALLDHHPGIELREAGEVMSAIGAKKAGDLLGEAFQAAFPEANAGGGGNPPQARGKTRTGSRA